jgi:hypothetical protein
MKNTLIVLFLLASLYSWAQPVNAPRYRLQPTVAYPFNNDDALTQVLVWDPTSKEFKWRSASSISSAGAFWALTGTSNLTGAVTIASSSNEHVLIDGAARFEADRTGNRNVAFKINPETGGVTGDGGLNITAQDPGDDEGVEIKVDDLAIEVGSDRTEADFEGIKYTADYSANFTSRSLVDKGYVDGITGGSFWALTGTSTLLGTATIDGDGNSVNFIGHSSFEVGGGNFNTFNAVSTIQLRQADTGLTSEIKADNAELIFSTQESVRLNIEDDGSWDIGGSNGSSGNVLTSNGAGSPPTWQAQAILKATVTIPATTFRTIGSSPSILIAAPGSGNYINIVSAVMSNSAGSTGYDFSGTSDIILDFPSGNGDILKVNESLVNTNGVWSYKFTWADDGTGGQGADLPANQALRVTTDDGGNATTGNRDVKIVIYYTIDSQ